MILVLSLGKLGMGMLVHVEDLGIGGYRLTAVAPCIASMQAALSALLHINPDGYTREQVEATAAQIAGRMNHPDRAVYGGEPFLGDIVTDPVGWSQRMAREQVDAEEIKAGGTD